MISLYGRTTAFTKLPEWMSHGASRGNRQLWCNALFLVFEPGTEARSMADGVFDLQSICAVSQSIVFRRPNSKTIGTHRCPSGKEISEPIHCVSKAVRIFEGVALALSLTHPTG